MELTKTTKHVLTYQVKEYIDQEGGMDKQEFGDWVADIKDAANNLELARIKDPDADWIIECRAVELIMLYKICKTKKEAREERKKLSCLKIPELVSILGFQTIEPDFNYGYYSAAIGSRFIKLCYPVKEQTWFERVILKFKR